MTRFAVGKLQEELNQAIEQVSQNGEPVVLERDGKEVAALVSIQDLEFLRAIEAREDEEDEQAAREFAAELATGRIETIDFEEYCKERGL